MGAGEYVVVEDEEDWLDDLPKTVRHISIVRCSYMKATTLDLRDVEGLKVLHLVDNAWLEEVLLSRTTCAHLRSLFVRVPKGMSLCCTLNDDWSSNLGTGQCQLKCFVLEGDVRFRSSRHSERRSLMLPFREIINNIAQINNATYNSMTLRELEITSAPVTTMDLGSILGGLRNLEFLKLSQLPSVRSVDMSTTCANVRRVWLDNMPSLKFIGGLETSHLEYVEITECNEVFALTIPTDSETNYFLRECKYLETISLGTMSSYCSSTGEGSIAHDQGGASSNTGRTYEYGGRLRIKDCPNVKNVDGLSQYTGSFLFAADENSLWAERFGDLLKDAGVDSSVCKATVRSLTLTGYNPAGLAGVQGISLEDAQHIGLFVSALFKARPKRLIWLGITCKEGGDCGCDQNAPRFGPLPIFPFLSRWFEYVCPQVRDLSSLAQWDTLEHLSLRGCTSVEVWPDFAAMTCLRYLDLSYTSWKGYSDFAVMTSLQELDLSYTSLKEYPAGVMLLPYLTRFSMDGCQQISTEELIIAAISNRKLKPPGHVNWIEHPLRTLEKDLLYGLRRLTKFWLRLKYILFAGDDLSTFYAGP